MKFYPGKIFRCGVEACEHNEGKCYLLVTQEKPLGKIKGYSVIPLAPLTEEHAGACWAKDWWEFIEGSMVDVKAREIDE